MSVTKAPRRRTVRLPATPTRNSTIKKVVVDFPEQLFMESDCVAAELGTNRSGFIRLAVEQFLNERRRRKLEQELIEGYTGNAAIARRIAEELAGAEVDFT